MPARTLAGAVLVLLISISSADAGQAAAPARPSASPLGSPASPRPAAALDVETETRLAADPAAERAWISDIALALAGEPADLAAVQHHVAAVLRLRSRRLTSQDAAWPDQQADSFLALLLIDPRRIVYDVDFRSNVVPIVATALDESVPATARRRMITQLRAFEFGMVEKVEVAWGIAPRSSRAREVRFDTVDLQFGAHGPIRASIYSLPSAYFRFEEAAGFLRSVHEIAPQREIVVLSNEPLIQQLRRLTDEIPVRLIDTLGKAYSPWPRDPFVVAASSRGPVTLVVRPNLQARRELDVFMAREIIQNLPEELDEAWQRVQWTLAPVPFHGGHMLTTPDAIWVSAHTLLPRVKEILGIREALDLQTLRRPQVTQSVVAAIGAAADELEAAFGLPVRLTHALPQTGTEAEIDAFEVVLGGGDGRDLDSILTIVSSPDGVVTGLVADLEMGRELLEAAPDADIRRIRELYQLLPSGKDLRGELGRAQSTPPNRQLQAYLDASAAYLRRQGIAVQRLPLLRVPEELVAEELRYARTSFMVSWNNVVLEQGAGFSRAEGFASGLDAADARVADIYASAGVSLRYVTPLSLSVMHDGGYRCASNHVRGAEMKAHRNPLDDYATPARASSIGR